MNIFLVPMLTLCFSLTPALALAGDQTVAVFDFEWIDTSLEGEMLGKNEAEQMRVQIMAPTLRDLIEATPNFTMIDIAPMREEAARQNLHACGRCAVTFTRNLGADIGVVAYVRKMSNLVLSITAHAFDAGSGETIAKASVSIRSNTDRSWNRGLHHLWENRMRPQFDAMINDHEATSAR